MIPTTTISTFVNFTFNHKVIKILFVHKFFSFTLFIIYLAEVERGMNYTAFVSGGVLSSSFLSL